MVRSPFVDKDGLIKGAWSEEEDNKLRDYVLRYGHWNWKLLPKFAGLARCGKSCRLRWYNYLKPGLKRGDITEQEHELIKKLHDEHGNKWSAIAAKLPGRTDNEIKNYWHTHFSSKHIKRSTSNNKVVMMKKKKKKIKRDNNFSCPNQDDDQALNGHSPNPISMYILESSSVISASSLEYDELFGSLPSLLDSDTTNGANNCSGSSGSCPNLSSSLFDEAAANICYSPRAVETTFQDCNYDRMLIVNSENATNCLDSFDGGFFDDSFWSEPFVLDK